MVPVCASCGTPHVTWRGKPACTAHAKNDDGTKRPCGNAPTPGVDICRYHGSNAPHVRAAAQRRVAEQEAMKQVKTLGLPLDITPTDALLQEVQWTAGHVQWLRTKVQELDAEPTHTAETLDGEDAGYGSPSGQSALVWGTTRVKIGGEDRGSTQEAKPSIWYALYESERKHLVSVCSAALRAGVEERKVRLAESQGDLVVAVIRRILDGLLAALLTAGLTEDRLTTAWTTAVADVVPRELRAIAGGS